MFSFYDLGRPTPDMLEAREAARAAALLKGRPQLEDRARLALARGLRGASHALARLARDVARPLHARARKLAEPLVEFHADAGAPEGALYVDGRLVGYVDAAKL